jgi:hypothetical protein
VNIIKLVMGWWREYKEGKNRIAFNKFLFVMMRLELVNVLEANMVYNKIIDKVKGFPKSYK